MWTEWDNQCICPECGSEIEPGGLLPVDGDDFNIDHMEAPCMTCGASIVVESITCVEYRSRAVTQSEASADREEWASKQMDEVA